MDPNELLNLIKFRRSIRRFSSKAVDKKIILDLIQAGRWAPSAGNRQPLEITIVDDQVIKDKLVEAAGRQSFIAEAPIVFVITANWERTSERYKERGKSLYCLQDTAAAIQNILLLATAFGLATCWIGAFREEMVSEFCGVPSHSRPVAMIPIGYPYEERPDDRDAPIRIEPEKFVFYNKYGKKYLQ
jgi:nitroreductase